VTVQAVNSCADINLLTYLLTYLIVRAMHTRRAVKIAYMKLGTNARVPLPLLTFVLVASGRCYGSH